MEIMTSDNNLKGLGSDRSHNGALRVGECSRLAAIVTLPGPKTGMTLATQWMVRRFEEEGPILLYDLAGPNFRPRYWMLQKAWRVFLSGIWLGFKSGRGADVVYLVANAKWGMLHTLYHVLISRLLGKSIVMHHHVCSYSNKYSVAMAISQGLMKSNDINIFLGVEQESNMSLLYSCRSSSRILPNAYMCSPHRVVARKRESLSPLVIGHMSNLTFDKGLQCVLTVVKTLVQSGENVKLILAGPINGKREQAAVKSASRFLGDNLDYRGPVYGEEKEAFYREIDCFFFPTRYKNEAQPIVLIEAMSFALPIVTTDQGCIASLVSESGCPVNRIGEPLESFCVAHLSRLARDSDYYNKLSLSVHEAFLNLHHQTEHSIDALLCDIKQFPISGTAERT